MLLVASRPTPSARVAYTFHFDANVASPTADQRIYRVLLGSKKPVAWLSEIMIID